MITKKALLLILALQTTLSVVFKVDPNSLRIEARKDDYDIRSKFIFIIEGRTKPGLKTNNIQILAYSDDKHKDPKVEDGDSTHDDSGSETDTSNNKKSTDWETATEKGCEFYEVTFKEYYSIIEIRDDEGQNRYTDTRDNKIDVSMSKIESIYKNKNAWPVFAVPGEPVKDYKCSASLKRYNSGVCEIQLSKLDK